MKIAFLGTPSVAVTVLESLIAGGHEIVSVVTRADTRRGRGTGSSPSPVKALALEHGLPVLVDPSELIDLGGDIDLGVVVAYGKIISSEVLAVVPMVNLHFSELPRWRGAAPVERAILAGDRRTGVCVMRVVPELDAGEVYACRSVDIGERETADELRRRLAVLGSDLLLDTLADGLRDPVPQTGEVTYAHKITSDDLRIDWSSAAHVIDRQVRVGGAWTTFRDRRVKIIETEPPIEGERLVPLRVQPEGRAPMAYEDWRRGMRPTDDEWFR